MGENQVQEINKTFVDSSKDLSGLMKMIYKKAPHVQEDREICIQHASLKNKLLYSISD